jgi:hypothetical protein
MATTGSAGQSAVMVQKRVVWLRHRKESIRRGIARRSGGRDMQTFAGAKHDYAKMSNGMARRRNGTAMRRNGMARRRYAWCWHSLAAHGSRKPLTSIGKELSSDGIE